MTREPHPDHSPEEPASSNVAQGGTSISSAKNVTVGGDVVGRDKIANYFQNTYVSLPDAAIDQLLSILTASIANSGEDETIPLAEAGRFEGRFALVATSNAWAQARLDSQGSYAGYLSELEAVWRWAEENEWNIGRQIRCAVIESSIRSQVERISPDLLDQAVEAKLWRPAHALAIIAQMADEGQRANAIVEIAPALGDKLQEQALQLTGRIQAEGIRAQTLSQLVRTLSPPLLAMASEMVRNIGDENARAEALVGLAPCLPGDVFQAAKAIRRGVARFKALSAVMPYLAESSISKKYRFEELSKAAQDAVREALKEGTLERILSETLPQSLSKRLKSLPRHLQAKVLQAVESAAIDLINYVEGLLVKSEASEDVLVLANQAFIKNCLRALDSLPRHLKSDYSLALEVALPVDLLAYTPLDRKVEIYQAALQAAKTLQYWSEYERDDVLSSMAARLPDDSPENLRDDVLQAVRTIIDDAKRAIALNSLASHWPESLRAEVWNESLQAAKSIKPEDQILRIVVLSAITPDMQGDLKEAALRDALQAMREIGLSRRVDPTRSASDPK